MTKLRMRARQGFWVLALAAGGLLAACGQAPDAATDDAPDGEVALTPNEAEAVIEGIVDEEELDVEERGEAEAEERADQPEAGERAVDETYPDLDNLDGPRVETADATVQFSQEHHLLAVRRDEGGDDIFRTSPLGGDAQAARAAVAAALQYPGDRVQRVQATSVEQLQGGSNELAALTYWTNDRPLDAAQLYRGRLAQANPPAQMVVTPLGDDRMFVFHLGWGDRRYRVLIAPEGDGSRIEVTQMYVAGTPLQEFDAGQGLLQAEQVPASQQEPAAVEAAAGEAEAPAEDAAAATE